MRVAWILLLVAATTAAASRIENTTGVPYQQDGGKPGDAPDTCGHPLTPHLVGAVQGTLVPGDDVRDYWRLDVPGQTENGSFQPVWVTLQPIPKSTGVSAAVPADLYVHESDRETGRPCARISHQSTNPGSAPDQVLIDLPGLYYVEVRLPAPFSAGVGQPGPGLAVCHPMCSDPTYVLTEN